MRDIISCVSTLIKYPFFWWFFIFLFGFQCFSINHFFLFVFTLFVYRVRLVEAGHNDDWFICIRYISWLEQYLLLILNALSISLSTTLNLLWWGWIFGSDFPYSLNLGCWVYLFFIVLFLDLGVWVFLISVISTMRIFYFILRRD